MFSFTYTSGVCKRKKMILSYEIGQKYKLQTPNKQEQLYTYWIQSIITLGGAYSRCVAIHVT